MKVSVIGTGYVGLVAAAAFAEHGNDVVCADIDEAKIAGLDQGVIPIYEPGLEPLVKRNMASGRLRFTTSNPEAAAHAEVVFLAVGTPSGGTDGAPKLDYLFQAARDIAPHLNGFTVIVNKSTVPVGTAERVSRIISEQNPDADFTVASNPEFLKEGVAVQDFMHPDRVIIGTDDERARDRLNRLYKPFFRTSERLLYMNPRSAELTKYAANAYLAARISFINDVANLCDAVGADVEEVRRGMGSDARIGNKFLFPGLGYGGSCFPKDTRAMIRTAREHGISMSIVAAADRINEAQKLVLVRKVRGHFGGELSGKTLALWGLAFKPNTDDIREAPALTIVRSLASDGVKLRLCDPEAGPNFMVALGDTAENFPIELCSDPYAAADGVDALILCTEWRQYRSPDFRRLAGLMSDKVLFDGRNQWDRDHVESLGFSYSGIGR
ncbi:UDP-glucose 6-dehydrogenase TuaD [Enhygromyxa salina]|uniref:UDP-glucose 6-dehydrogenase n=1 Tax=Enhygromyxa salina TaxID=215803 RepID=A0A2S9XBM1_9BACT|nr:UDP-glucose/GDP-mannose dehydrogenase family protein [Enhygromyxa salina]PRP90091.1 UDP-glucose 6-dehydrogenase TuaD [Enhygromyxa salina]